MRRDFRRHPHRDAVRAVDEQVRHARRQHRWLFRGLVEIGDEVHRLFLDVREQLLGHARQAALRVAVGRRGVAIHGAEIPLAVNQRVAHVEALRHADQGVVNGRVAVRVVFLDDLANHARALDVALVGGVALLVHRVENAAMHGLQAVAHVGQGAPDDYAHRVIEIRLPHLVFNINRLLARGPAWGALRRLGRLARRCRQFFVRHQLAPVFLCAVIPNLPAVILSAGKNLRIFRNAGMLRFAQHDKTRRAFRSPSDILPWHISPEIPRGANFLQPSVHVLHVLSIDPNPNGRVVGDAFAPSPTTGCRRGCLSVRSLIYWHSACPG